MWLYKALLFLYPSAWRAEYGSAICADFASRRGFLVCFEVIADTVSSAAAVHWDYLRQDLRYNARKLGRSPGFALAAIGIAAIGIGATTAAFTLVDHVLIRPLPYAQPDRLVKLWTGDVNGRGYSEASPANYRDWKQMSQSFVGMEASRSLAVILTRPGEPQPVEGASGTGRMFELLGVPPAFGRTVTPEDDRESAPGVVVLSHGLWQDRF